LGLGKTMGYDRILPSHAHRGSSLKANTIMDPANEGRLEDDFFPLFHVEIVKLGIRVEPRYTSNDRSKIV
jgi:hypothetical protein